MSRFVFCLALAVLAPNASAASFEARVHHVGDGDTVWVRSLNGGANRPIRLEGIDAPEICQRWGPQARDALAARVLRQRVRIVVKGHDDWGRTLGRVAWRGEDVGGWLVREGHAWSYRFRGDAGPYASEQRLARQARAGLWRERSPVEPRDFRRRHGACAHDENSR